MPRLPQARGLSSLTQTAGAGRVCLAALGPMVLVGVTSASTPSSRSRSRVGAPGQGTMSASQPTKEGRGGEGRSLGSHREGAV